MASATMSTRANCPRETNPAGNHLHVEDDACHIDLALIGRYILANDNNGCGGANVRFWGVWKRAQAK